MAEQWTREKVERILCLAQDIVSLNTKINPEDGEEELECFIEDEAPTPEDIVIKQQTNERLRQYMDLHLKPREAEILKLRYGFDTETPMTLEEVGRELGLTRERIRQIEHRALRKLRVVLIKNQIALEDI